MDHRRQLRNIFRHKRHQLTLVQQENAALVLVTQAKDLPILHQSQHIAYYLANDHEINPVFLIQALSAQGKILYLPILNPQQEHSLLFVQYQVGDALQINRYGIPEPIATPQNTKQAADLDLILLPLVTFDTQGNRLGMGGGYYDYTLAFKHTVKKTKPYLIGLAYECQKADALPQAPWDVTLNAIITEQSIYLIA